MNLKKMYVPGIYNL